jgi:hypothetical protein
MKNLLIISLLLIGVIVRGQESTTLTYEKYLENDSLHVCYGHIDYIEGGTLKLQTLKEYKLVHDYHVKLDSMTFDVIEKDTIGGTMYVNDMYDTTLYYEINYNWLSNKFNLYDRQTKKTIFFIP